MQSHSTTHIIRRRPWRFQKVEQRLQKRINALEYIRSIPEFYTITIQEFPARRILAHTTPLAKPIDWELELVRFEKEGRMPPSLFIGDPGFFVDLNKVESRASTEFTGFFLFADDPFIDHPDKRTELPADYSIERTLSDHNLSKNPEHHITEIQIPINESKPGRPRPCSNLPV